MLRPLSLAVALLTVPALAQTGTRFNAALTGAQVVPPSGSTAGGIGSITLFEPANIAFATLDVDGFTTAMNMTADVHIGAAGANAPVRFTLGTGFGTNPPFCGAAQLTPAEVATLKTGGFYVDVKTSAQPAGAIRGQFDTGATSLFVAPMDGAQEVPPVTTSALGHAGLLINADGTAQYAVAASVSGTAAHFHRGAAGVSGPAVLTLAGGPTYWEGDTRVLTAAEIADARNGLWYANVHTAAHPGGEVRGQLRPAVMPTIFGTSCAGTGGRMPVTAVEIPPLLGTWTELMLMAEAKPGAPMAYLLDVAPLATPLNLAILGAPNCNLYMLGVITVPMVTDKMGCAAFEILTPLLRSLLGTAFYGQNVILDLGAQGGLVATNATRAVVQ